MRRHLVVGLLALLPLLAAMPCLCASDAPEKSKSCCCPEEKPAKPSKCCCTIKIKPEFTVETPSTPAEDETAILVEASIVLPVSEGFKTTFAVDTGPPDRALYQSISVLRL